MGKKFKTRMEKLQETLKADGLDATNSKLYNSIQEKMSNLEKPVLK